jgi:hypothetical protein
MDTRRDDEPAWTTHARRILPGQQIIINRDDDAEEGDIGIRQTGSPTQEKLENSEGSSGGSSSSRTRREEIEMQENRRSSEAGTEEHDPAGGERGGIDREGQRTPPLAEYREGNHLVVERRRGDGDEVEVEVIRNHFHDDKPAEASTFTHPRRLKHRELEQIKKHLPKSLEHATSRVENHGKDAVDRLGLGLMNPSPTESEVSDSASRRGLSELQAPEQHEGSDGDYENVHEMPSIGRQSTPPAVRVQHSKGLKGLRKRFFGRRSSPGPPSPGAAEEGRASPDSKPLAPPTLTRSRTQTDERALELTRTLSVPRNTAIRFAAETSESSETAPSMNNYGNAAPGFKRNPALAMCRTNSVQSTGSTKGEGPSVSFREPERRR